MRAVTPDHAEGLQYHVLPTDDPLRALNILREVAGLQPVLMSTIRWAEKPVRVDLERREPRCRICRDETVRILVNELLDWRGVPIILGRGKIHRITLTPRSSVAWCGSTRAVTEGPNHLRLPLDPRQASLRAGRDSGLLENPDGGFKEFTEALRA